jgi:hypothetical protein
MKLQDYPTNRMLFQHLSGLRQFVKRIATSV